MYFRQNSKDCSVFGYFRAWRQPCFSGRGAALIPGKDAPQSGAGES